MYVVIMAGGGGTRLWPLSRAAHPKPFLRLVDDRTLLQATADRLAPLVTGPDIHVVVAQRFADLVAEQLPEVPARNVLLEPVGRNTAAAVAFAACAIDRPMDEVMIVLPADQRIADAAAFRDALAAAAERAAGGDLVTLGITPDGPETGYGYVLAVDAPAQGAQPGRHAAVQVERFVEKPDIARARELLASGRASWNGGIFVWRRDALLDGLARHAPDILDTVRDAVAGGVAALAAAYPDVRATSIDYALLEPASLVGKVAVVPADVGWSDLGSWDALLKTADTADAAASGVHARDDVSVVDVGSEGVLLEAAAGRTVAVVGLRNVVIVDTPDALLVCAADAAQDVKLVVDRLRADGREDLL